MPAAAPAASSVLRSSAETRKHLADERTERAARGDDRPFGAEGAAGADRDGRRDRLEERHARRDAALVEEHLLHRLRDAVAADRRGAVARHQADDRGRRRPARGRRGHRGGFRPGRRRSRRPAAVEREVRDEADERRELPRDDAGREQPRPMPRPLMKRTRRSMGDRSIGTLTASMRRSPSRGPPGGVPTTRSSARAHAGLARRHEWVSRRLACSRPRGVLEEHPRPPRSRSPSRAPAPRARVVSDASSDAPMRPRRLEESRLRGLRAAREHPSARPPSGPARRGARRREPPFGVTSLRSTRCRTTTDTELWSVSVRRARSFSDDALSPDRACRTKSCALLMPAPRSASRALRRSSRTMRRRASRTARMRARVRSRDRFVTEGGKKYGIPLKRVS